MKLRLDDSGLGALPRAVVNCVVGGDGQRCPVATAAAEPETAALGAAERQASLPRSRPQRQLQLRALDLLMLLKRLP